MERRPELDVRLAALANGDRDAFDPVFEIVWPVARRFAVRWLGESAGAEDAAQQALLAVFARASEYDRDRDGMRWVLGIVANECRSARKRTLRRREVVPNAHVDAPSEAASPEDEVLDEELRIALAAALDDLGRSDAETIVASVLERARPDIAPATFRKRLERALGRLRRVWEVGYGR
jgi:RNA polymerase sigma factor (sigma-70 family)